MSVQIQFKLFDKQAYEKARQKTASARVERRPTARMQVPTNVHPDKHLERLPCRPDPITENQATTTSDNGLLRQRCFPKDAGHATPVVMRGYAGGIDQPGFGSSQDPPSTSHLNSSSASFKTSLRDTASTVSGGAALQFRTETPTDPDIIRCNDLNATRSRSPTQSDEPATLTGLAEASKPPDDSSSSPTLTLNNSPSPSITGPSGRKELDITELPYTATPLHAPGSQGSGHHLSSSWDKHGIKRKAGEIIGEEVIDGLKYYMVTGEPSLVSEGDLTEKLLEDWGVKRRRIMGSPARAFTGPQLSRDPEDSDHGSSRRRGSFSAEEDRLQELSVRQGDVVSSGGDCCDTTAEGDITTSLPLTAVEELTQVIVPEPQQVSHFPAQAPLANDGDAPEIDDSQFPIESILDKWSRHWFLIRWEDMSCSWVYRTNISEDAVKEFEASYPGFHSAVEVLKSKRQRRRKKYLVSWTGCAADDVSWVTEKKLNPELVANYKSKDQKRREKGS